MLHGGAKRWQLEVTYQCSEHLGLLMSGPLLDGSVHFDISLLLWSVFLSLLQVVMPHLILLLGGDECRGP